MKNKVLILEDVEGHFKRILECFKDKSEVYPNDQDSFRKLKQQFVKIRDSKEALIAGNPDISTKERNTFFSELLEDQDYETFIIDVGLKGDSDKLGEDFVKYLVAENYNNGKSKIIIYSGQALDDDEDEKFHYLSKGDVGQFNKLKGLLSSNSSAIKEYNKIQYFFQKQIQYSIHVVITLFFYATIIGSSLYGGYKIISDMLPDGDSLIQVKQIGNDNIEVTKVSADSLKSFINNKSVNIKKSSNKPIQLLIEKEKKDESKTLKFVEHVFLYSIPIFILIGFFGYYKSDFKRTLFDRPKNEKILESSKSSIKLAKTLFLSSMMSYVIIKIIEELFLSHSTISTERLIAFGVLLFLLMGYLLISHMGESKGQDDKH